MNEMELVYRNLTKKKYALNHLSKNLVHLRSLDTRKHTGLMV